MCPHPPPALFRHGVVASVRERVTTSWPVLVAVSALWLLVAWMPEELGACETEAASTPPVQAFLLCAPDSPPFVPPFSASAGEREATVRGDSARYLLIHLDGVSSEVFLSELEAGNLENLRDFFSDRGIIGHGVTYYPPFTSAVVKRMRHAQPIHEGEVIAWGVYDPVQEANEGRARVLRRYARTVPRRARGNFFLGFPFMDHLAGMAMWNSPELVETYGVMEYYWFGTDTAGHIWGESAQRRNLRRFDRYFSRMVANLPDDVNVVVYADHGMTFGEVFDYDQEVADFLDGRARNYTYPHVYLHDPEDRAEVAREIVRRTWQDFAFYEDEPGRIVGFGPEARFAFHREGDAIRYEHDGGDPLGYGDLGYAGEYLEPDDWLSLTHRAEFPFAPVRVLELFDNDFVGDVVVVLNDNPKAGPWVYAGNHHGLKAADMNVPVLVRGPELEHLYGQDYVRIEDVLERASPDPFKARPPSRELHSATLSVRDDDGPAAGAEFTFSPRYRLQVGAEVGPEVASQVWTSADFLSGYLSRLWLGVGIRDDPDQRPLARMDYQFRVRRMGVDLRLTTGESTRLDLFYRLNRHVDLKLRDLEAVGIRTRF